MALRSNLPEIAARIDAEIRAAVRVAAEEVASAARDRVPVDDGDLRDAIHVKETPEGCYVIAGDRKVFYGHMVEHGHAKENGGQVAPRPFLIPALEEKRAEIIAELAAAARKAT